MEFDVRSIVYFIILLDLLIATVYLMRSQNKILNSFYAIQIKANHSRCKPVEIAKHHVIFYPLSSSYHYEYRYELNLKQNSSNESRLILLLTGRGRSCIDWWGFSVGDKILSKMRSAGYSILALCTNKKDYTVRMPIQKNRDVYWIDVTFRMWMKSIYLKEFQHYPRLYLFGLSQGSRMGSLLSRVLPIQAQILYIYPGYKPSLLIHSDYDREIQNRLVLDPIFANWFYFDFCSRKSFITNNYCLFHNQSKNYFNPVPPTYFIHATNDRLLKLDHYLQLIFDIRKDAFRLGGSLLTHNESIKLSISTPVPISSDYMHKNFNKWFCKPWSSQFFYKHHTKAKYITKNRTLNTCWCMKINFLYYTQFPNVTKTWSDIEQHHFHDYVQDWKRFRFDICEEICGDLYGQHSMTSQHLDRTVDWLNEIDTYRSKYKIEDLLRRPLRIWMYNKSELIQNDHYRNYSTTMKTDCGRNVHANQMYSVEYILQDYFQRLKNIYPKSQHDIIWSKDPLLADYYIIPHDYACMALDHYRSTLTDFEYRAFYKRLNHEYFLPLLINIEKLFPFWNMTFGSNHLIAFTLGKNMGVVQNRTIQDRLKNVIQLGLTGFRQDLLPYYAQPLYLHRNITPIYRHNYDIIIPPFNRLQRLNNKPVTMNYDWNQWYRQKKNLLFFAGTVNKSNSQDSVRQRFSSFVRETIGEKRIYKNKTIFGKKELNTLIFIDGYQTSNNYVNSIRSSIFHLCLEGVSPWSPRLYESISFGAIPLILAESIVLPFERFIDWHSFSVIINVETMTNMIDSIKNIQNFENYVQQKLINETSFFHAFRWPYSAIDEKYDQHVFLSDEDLNGRRVNVLHYLSLELRCRRLEQFYGLTSDSLSISSGNAKQYVCSKYSSICPCEYEQRRLGLAEYF
ncbi:hypothetical protein I4U23_023615 [Adineta vaga]|nr:hypothetical protein I4U23_023615 [Adineta vaga]